MIPLSDNPCSNNPCSYHPDAKCVIYKGNALSTLEVVKYERLDSILDKINSKITANTANLQNVLSTGSVLTQDNTIDGGGFILTWTNFDVIYTDSVFGVTASLSDSSTKFATTAFVKGQNYITANSTTTLSNKTGNISQWTNDSGYLTSTGITPAAITRTNDTNVTLSLSGTSSTALLQPISITAGWTGTLADGRIASAGVWNAKQDAITTGTTLQYLRGDLSLGTFPTVISTFTNDSGYITASSSSALTNKTGNISQWTNNSGYITSSALSTYLLSATAASTYTPLTRTLTINGTAHDLSSDRSWTVSSGADNNYVDVTDYGADSSGVSDSTAAFNLAIAAAVSTGKMKVYIPAGTYLITAVYLTSASGINKQGIQLVNGIGLFGAGVGKTIIKLQNATTATTVNSYFYPVINGHGASNCIIHDLEINGNKANQGNYTSDPYTNPAGYYSDPANRWSTPAIMFKDGDRNEVYNVYAHDSQLMGFYAYNCTNNYVHHFKATDNGGSGVLFHLDSDGVIEDSVCTLNNSDQIRIDDCDTGAITIIRSSEASFSGSSVTATNWFAGIYTGGTTINVLVDGCWIHDNSAYGVDLPSTSTSNFKVVNSTIEYNGNGGIVTSGGTAIISNNFLNNGKKRNGATDTVSNYNPAAIVVNSASGMTIIGNRGDNTTSSQVYFIKSWGGGGSTGFNKSTVIGNDIKGIADVAHTFNGDDGTNMILGNSVKNTSGTVKSYDFMSNAVLAPDNYFTINSSAATGDTTLARIGANSSNDGIFDVYNASNQKLLQYGGAALSLLGTYNLQGFQNLVSLGTAPSSGNTTEWKITTATGDAFFLGSMALGTATQDSKSILTLSSTTKGALFSRMTNTQRDAISSPPEGLWIYSLTDHTYQYYNGTTWKTLATV